MKLSTKCLPNMIFSFAPSGSREPEPLHPTFWDLHDFDSWDVDPTFSTSPEMEIVEISFLIQQEDDLVEKR